MASREATPRGQPTRRLDVFAGIDFGTTYSKIAFAIPNPEYQVHPSRCEVIHLKAFSSEGFQVSTKYPASIYNGSGYNGKWLEWFKLSLPYKDDLPHDIRVSKKLDIFTKEREAQDMSAADVTSKFLAVIWKHAHEKICARVKNIDRFAQCHIVITVTVPAIWPADARKRLYQAIQSANILGPNVRLARKFVTEAEAAGIALMSATSVYPGNLEGSGLQDGETVIICDCGGGTTDLISYQVVSFQPFAVWEISPGKCIFAGGALVDDAFLDLVKRKVKRVCPGRTFKALTDTDFDGFIKDIWDDILKEKHSVHMVARSFPLPRNFLEPHVRQNPRAYPDSLMMTFTADDINGVFDPIVDKIVDLIDSEMSLVHRKTGNPTKHVVVAGGFGRNLYLLLKIGIMAESSSDSTTIARFQGNEGWNSVARGAVFHGIQANGKSRQPIVQVNARASGEGYGLESSTDGSILWLNKVGDGLSADGQNRRPVPPQAVWHGRDGRSYVNIYRQEGPDANPGFASCLSWNDVGELQSLEFNFHWDGTRMHYVLYQGNQQVPLTIENYYDL
ncbi:hypothetical protein F53441_8442 [Fusarium austroafricanum]|uniref:Actin-like ATPase domain-containing protein n=1 Tax=Fusarium austroafricanum TaxID=2364996 RepID=A0A8H4NXD4_9HYPO|nr:hypothetical protein F53441_8442 [Fusarium austroafricanum]